MKKDDIVGTMTTQDIIDVMKGKKPFYCPYLPLGFVNEKGHGIVNEDGSLHYIKDENELKEVFRRLNDD